MLRFNISKRLPKKPLIGLAVLALALVAAGGGATSAQAQTPASFTIELSFDTITFPAIDDCEGLGEEGCRDANVYGTLNGRTTSTGVTYDGARNIGTWGNAAGCKAWWNAGPVQCARYVGQGSLYAFQSAYMCASHTHLYCTGTYQQNNNKIRLAVKPGEQIRAGIHLYDHDKVSADDGACAVTRWVGPFTAAQLTTLNMSNLGMGMAFNGDAGCTAIFSMKRVA